MTQCGPCKILAGELQELSQRFGDAVDVLKLDTEKYGDLASAMMIRGLPTIMFIKDTTLLFRTEGAVGVDDLESLVNYFFFNGPKPDGLQVREAPPS